VPSVDPFKVFPAQYWQGSLGLHGPEVAAIAESCDCVRHQRIFYFGFEPADRAERLAPVERFQCVDNDIEDVALGHSPPDHFGEFIDAWNRILGFEPREPQVPVRLNAEIIVPRIGRLMFLRLSVEVLLDVRDEPGRIDW
jgi:hypothetical protein